VNNLSCLLYRDERAHGAIRVRHLSIRDFFVSDDCPGDYRVDLGDANAQLGTVCLKTMIGQLRFNICKLEDSRLANKDVQDLECRIKDNISDALQYSSLYWSNHLCDMPDKGDRDVLGSLKEFVEGLSPLFWIEVLSIMGMVSIGAPSVRRVISWVKVSNSRLRASFQDDPNLLKDADSAFCERLQDVCHFIITFHYPLSISTPHTYLSTGPFLPSQSGFIEYFQHTVY
jgi:hypothetical protein